LRFRCNLACLARLLQCLWTRRRRILLWRLLLLARVFRLRAPLPLCLLGVWPLLAPCRLLLRLLLLLLRLLTRRMLWRLGVAIACGALALLVLVLPLLALLPLLPPGPPRRSW
jgi:hypothetical protein